MSTKDLLNQDKMPKHIAIIMDGNGRWAKQQGKLRTFGHASGVTAVKDVTEGAAEFIYRADGLRNWFQTRHATGQVITNPLTNLPITRQDQISRFTAVVQQGGYRKRSKKAKAKAKARTRKNTI